MVPPVPRCGALPHSNQRYGWSRPFFFGVHVDCPRCEWMYCDLSRGRPTNGHQAPLGRVWKDSEGGSPPRSHGCGGTEAACRGASKVCSTAVWTAWSQCLLACVCVIAGLVRCQHPRHLAYVVDQVDPLCIVSARGCRDLLCSYQKEQEGSEFLRFAFPRSPPPPRPMLLGMGCIKAEIA